LTIRLRKLPIFNVSIFNNSRITAVDRYPEGPYGKAGSVMTITLELNGLELTILNAGPVFKLNEAFSLLVHCKTQEEVDYFWEKLLEGSGKQGQCGWLKDRFGFRGSCSGYTYRVTSGSQSTGD
jgi:predicted 3-demethylubiquinone-9 3-methyltransferase (glyoxalase superfamily)